MSIWDDIIGVAQKAAPVALAGSGLAGILANRRAANTNIQSVQQQQAVTAAQLDAFNKQLGLQQKYANMSPQDFMAGISGFMRPLSAGLTSGVGNVVQANMAERGLAQSPGIFSEVMAQALAPFQQQTQQDAISAYFKSLGLPIEAAPKSPSMPYTPYPQAQSTAGIWQYLMSMLANKGKLVPSITRNSGGGGNTPVAGSIPQMPMPTNPGDTVNPPDVYGDASPDTGDNSQNGFMGLLSQLQAQGAGAGA